MRIDWESVWHAIFVVMFAIGVIFASRALYCTMTSSGRPDYCYIDVMHVQPGAAPQLMLVQHRPWASNAVAGVFSTTNEALAAAKSIDCPLH